MKPYSFCPVCANSLDYALIGGRQRMLCLACQWVHYINPIPAAIAYTINKKGELLVVRRAHEPAINEWALPGGFLEAGEDARAGCLRELLEETSLTGKIDRLIGIYHLDVKKYGSLLIIAYRVVVDDDAISLNHELSDGGFYPLYHMPEIGIPLHRQIIHDAVLPESGLLCTYTGSIRCNWKENIEGECLVDCVNLAFVNQNDSVHYSGL
jgi:ADP-ribose pyrophosphatase YjhB (NUDIX family)